MFAFVPSYYLCPICGEWHDWKPFQFRKPFCDATRDSPMILPCTKNNISKYFSAYTKFFFEHDLLKYEIYKFYDKTRIIIDGSYPEKLVYLNLKKANFQECIIYLPANALRFGKLDLGEDKYLKFGFK